MKRAAIVLGFLAVAAACGPAPSANSAIDLKTLHVTFLSDTPPASAIAKAASIQSGRDQMRLVGNVAYLHCPDGYGRSKLTNTALEKALGCRGTTRNWNSVGKLKGIAEELGK